MCGNISCVYNNYSRETCIGDTNARTTMRHVIIKWSSCWWISCLVSLWRHQRVRVIFICYDNHKFKKVACSAQSYLSCQTVCGIAMKPPAFPWPREIFQQLNNYFKEVAPSTQSYLLCYNETIQSFFLICSPPFFPHVFGGPILRFRGLRLSEDDAPAVHMAAHHEPQNTILDTQWNE